MGVKGLWGMLKDAAEVEIPENKTLAIDISIWIHYYKDMKEKDIIYNVSKRIIKLLYHNIKPVFIFDGTPNEMKRKVLLERKKLNHTKLIKDIIDNKTCKKCNKSIRTCRHGGMLNFKIRNELESHIKDNLESHDERWGEDYVTEPNIEYNTSRKKSNNVVINELLINNIVKSNKLTTNQKLKMLLKMRENRKEKLGYNDNTPLEFSDSQLINIKKRNLISFYIRKLEREKNSIKVQSDCFKEFTFSKNVPKQKVEESNVFIKPESQENDEDSLDHLFSNEEDLRSKKEVSVKTEQPSNSIDNLFDLCSTNLNDKYNEINHDNKYRDVIIDDKFIEKLEYKENTSKALDIDTIKDINSLIEQRIDDDSSSSSSQDIGINNIDEEFDLEKVRRRNIVLEDDDTNFDFSSVQTIFKKILEIFSLPYLVPPGEADSQCGFLSAQGIVDGVVTEDNDVLLYGGVVYRNFFRKNKLIEKYTPQKILEICKFTQVDLINMSFVLGSDYTLGINGIGTKKVVDYIKGDDFLKLDTKKYQDIYLNPAIDKQYRLKFNVIDLSLIIKYYRHKDIDSEKISELIFYLKNMKKMNK